MLKGTGHAAGCLWCVIFCVILTCSSCSQFGTFWHYSAWIQVKPSSCRVFEVVLSCLLNRWILRKQAPHDLPHSRTLFYGKCSIYIWHPMAIYGREPSFCMLLLLPKAVNWFSWCSDCWCYLHLQRWWYVMIWWSWYFTLFYHVYLHGLCSRGLIRQVLLKVTPLTGPQYFMGNQTITVFENTLSTLKWGWVKTCYYHVWGNNHLLTKSSQHLHSTSCHPRIVQQHQDLSLRISQMLDEILPKKSGIALPLVQNQDDAILLGG